MKEPIFRRLELTEAEYNVVVEAVNRHKRRYSAKWGHAVRLPDKSAAEEHNTAIVVARGLLEKLKGPEETGAVFVSDEVTARVKAGGTGLLRDEDGAVWGAFVPAEYYQILQDLARGLGDWKGKWSVVRIQPAEETTP